jgi:hypothetical protein
MQLRADALEDGPQHPALLLGQACLAAQPSDVTVRLPGIELPRIYDLGPFREEEARRDTRLAASGSLVHDSANRVA